jgi:hypothetical protein
MRRARMEGSAPYLWLLAMILGAVLVALDLRFSCGPEPRSEPPPRPADTPFIELPALPRDAGANRSPR